jgi:hypothetical protein
MENAIKAAESDARKRAMVSFGNAFRHPLYDRERKGMAALPAPARPNPAASKASTRASTRPSAIPPRSAR